MKISSRSLCGSFLFHRHASVSFSIRYQERFFFDILYLFFHKKTTTTTTTSKCLSKKKKMLLSNTICKSPPLRVKVSSLVPSGLFTRSCGSENILPRLKCHNLGAPGVLFKHPLGWKKKKKKVGVKVTFIFQSITSATSCSIIN